MTVLKNPPTTHDERGNTESNWRLTPDRIQRWMTVILDKKAAEREAEHNKLKISSKEKLPDVDYESFRKRMEEGTALREVKSDAWLKGDDAYSKFRAQRLQKEIQKEKQETQNQDGNE